MDMEKTTHIIPFGTNTWIEWPLPWDECDCDERCPHCGKRKKRNPWDGPYKITWTGNINTVMECEH